MIEMPDRIYDHSRELLRLLPRVLRARDFHLYLETGKRLVDLWVSGGKAVLGHKRPRVLGELKNAAERGLFCALPHPLERRFIKALEKFFPNRAFRLYADGSSLFRALANAGLVCGNGLIIDPAFPPEENVTHSDGRGSVSLWRPFLEPEPSISSDQKAAFLVPVLPWPLSPAVLVLDKNMEELFPPGELISPALLAPAARALHDLSAILKNYSADRSHYAKIEKVLKNSKEQQRWRRWHSHGIYLTVEPGMNQEEYAALFRRFLDGGFLIPPSPAEPLILPLSMSAGEEAKLAELLTD
jgi:hypothetical protein